MYLILAKRAKRTYARKKEKTYPRHLYRAKTQNKPVVLFGFVYNMPKIFVLVEESNYRPHDFDAGRIFNPRIFTILFFFPVFVPGSLGTARCSLG